MTLIKKNQKLFVLVWCIGFLPISGFAQVSLTGEFRPRTEFRNGYRVLNTEQSDPAFFTSQRTRLNVLSEADLYDVKFSAQDVRTWGEVTQLDDTPNLNVHEVWVRIHITENIKLKIGRQELVYDDQRLLGSVDWAQQGRSHDALLFNYENPAYSFKLDAGAAFNQETEKLEGTLYSLNNYKALSFLWLNKSIGILNMSGLFLADGFQVQPDKVKFRYTYGTHFKINASEHINATGTLYLQKGADANREDISAYMAAGSISYQLSPFVFTAGYDYLSGGKANDGNPEAHAFNTLYATNHKFYGHMDYFLNIPVETQFGGLQDLNIDVEYKPSQNTGLNMTLHRFFLANEITYSAGLTENLNRSMGTEVDLSFTHNFSDTFKLKTGYSLLFRERSLELIQNREAAGLQQWGWVMLVVNPKLL